MIGRISRCTPSRETSGPWPGFAARDLIDLVDEDNSHLLGAFDGHAGDLIHIEQFVLFFLDQIFKRVGDRHLALFLLLPEHAGKHVFQIDVHLLDALVGDDFKRRHRAFAYFDVDHALIELPFAQLCPQFLASAQRLLTLLRDVGFSRVRRQRGRRWQQQVEDALFGGLLGAVGNLI